jgi:catechol 2,3-dioxygenase-like lactoylglutathione lyase family enzyme
MTANLLLTVPVLLASDIGRAERFYCGRLGFTRDWIYQPHAELADPGFMGLSRGDARLHVSSFRGDGVFGSVVSFYVDDVDALFAEYRSGGVEVDLEPIDQTWGNREMYLRDPDDNKLRFIQARQDEAGGGVG